MSLLQDYKKFLYVLVGFGMCSFSVHQITGRIYCSRLLLVANRLFILSITCTSIAIIYSRTEATFRTHTTFSGIQVASNFVQVMVYCCVLFLLLIKQNAHMAFLNGLADFDTRILNRFGVRKVDKSSFFRKTWIENMSFVCVLSILLIVSDYEGIDPIQDELNFLLYKVLIIMIVSMVLIILHVRSCALLLQNRFSMIGNRMLELTVTVENIGCDDIVLHEEFVSAFDFLDDLWHLKRLFSETFGFIVLLNSAFDMALLIIDVFMGMLFYVLGNTTPSGTLVIIGLTYFWCPVLKLLLLACALEPFGKQVLAAYTYIK